MVHIYINFDENGNWESNQITGSLTNLPQVSVSNNVLNDCNICSRGYNPPPNLFSGESTCLATQEVLESEPVPDWVSYNIYTNVSSKETRTKPVATQYGFWQITTDKYDRTTTFGVSPQPNQGTPRTFSFTVWTGYYLGSIDQNSGFIRDSYTMDSLVTITIMQKGYRGQGLVYSNPYYCSKKNETLVDDSVEAEGVAHIYITISSDGNDYTVNKLSLVAKQYNYNYPDSPFNGTFSVFPPTGSITNVPAWVNYNIRGDESLEPWDDFYTWMNLTYHPNTSTSPRQGVITVETLDSRPASHVRFEIHLWQDGIPVNPDLPDEQSMLYFEYNQLTLPASASSEDYSTLFHYSNITNVQVASDAAWLTANASVTSRSEGVVEYSWDANESGVNRTATITLSGTSTIDGTSLQATIEVIQLIDDSGGDEPIEGDTTGTFVAIDINSGENYDSTALLFKDNAANIYSTLESKDNTLFLGNYLNSDFSLKIHNGIGSSLVFNVNETLVNVPMAAKNETAYSYTPDMSLSSQQKRLFKKGETYSLGLVFVRKDGTKSSVFYIGDFAPTSEPAILISSGSYYLSKPQAYISISSAIVAELVALDVIGVIPVVAERGNHKIICQGFLNPTISSRDRRSSENLTSQYNWFQRLVIDSTTTAVGEGESNHVNFAEFQSRGDDDEWTFNSSILTMNTPELEASDLLTNAELEGCIIQPLWISSRINYTNSVQVSVNGKYLHSKAILPTGGYRTDRRETSLDMWYGFIDKGTMNENTDANFIISTKDNDNYGRFFIYPWQRNTVGGEGPGSFINSKKYFTSMYIDSTSSEVSSLGTLSKASIYKDNFPSLLKFGNEVYQGTVDYIINITKPYKAFITQSYSIEGHSYNYPKAYSEVGVYSGYSSTGEISDPIYMRYKVPPHLALYFDSPVSVSGGVVGAELSHSADSYIFENDPQVLSSLTWIKCGDIVPLGNNTARVYFTEGDYFYGRFDTLRTYPYTQEDANSVTDIVSGMLCSRVNLDARCDRNRGVGTALVTPENFNRFNDVYNQSNNYFTFQYFNLTDKVYERKFSNSIQWSMPKSYGDEIDGWCNIQEINTLDLDGNKGSLKALRRLNNNIVAFQDSGISQVLYNETMQIAATNGTPIEIGNSGRVSGKRYLYETVGCQDERAITSTPYGLYFIDSINKSFYRLGADNSMVDLCSNGGMKSWGLSNLDASWKCWYDIYSKEVVLVSPTNSLIYSDVFNIFQCFASYEGIEYTFPLNGITYLMKEDAVQQYSTIWQRNAIDSSIFFDEIKPIEIEVVANPNPTTDKAFTNIEYRADGFKEGNYRDDFTFKTLRVWNEYQDTGTITLSNWYRPSNLKKKFRMWHIDIPRSNNTMDRIRNPWCNIKLTTNTMDIDKFVLYDIQVQYLQL